MAYRRVNIQDPNNPNLVYQTKTMKCDQTGNTFQKEITVPNAIPLKRALADGVFVEPYSLENFQKLNNMNNMNGNNGDYLPFAVLPSETDKGNRTMVREETGQNIPNVLQYRITLDNTTANPVEMVIFDGAGLVFEKLKLSAPPVGLVVGGTFGTNTLAQLKTNAGLIPADLHRIWIQNTTSAGAVSTVFFDSGFLSESRANLAGQSLFDSEIPLQTMLRPGDYQTNIRVSDGFRMLIDPLAALHLEIPAGQKVSISLDISAAALSYGMVKQ